MISEMVKYECQQKVRACNGGDSERHMLISVYVKALIIAGTYHLFIIILSAYQIVFRLNLVKKNALDIHKPISQ